MVNLINKRIDRQNNGLYFCLFFLFLLSMGLWIGWDDRSIPICAILSVLIFVVIKAGNIKLVWNKRNVFSLIVFIIAYSCVYRIGLGVIFGIYIPAVFIFLLNDRDRVNCLQFICKWFSVLIIPSLILYVIFKTWGLPSFGTIYVQSDALAEQLKYHARNNHLFLVTYVLRETDRFNGPFIEPGHVGMMCSFLLYSVGFPFKKMTTWVLLVTVIMTMSLTGFVMTFLGYLFVKCEQGKLKIKSILSISVLLLFFYLVSLNYNGGDNLIYENLFERLQPDEDRGIAGNNRSSLSAHLYFLTMFSDWRLILFGYDENTLEMLANSDGLGTGMEVYMITHGLIGCLCSISFYLVYFLKTKKKKTAGFSLVFVLLLLVQRSYWFWFSWMICFMYGITLREVKFCKKNCSDKK